MALTKISTGGVKDDAASQAKIADEAIDEARLQVSNAGSNGQFLSKQTGNTGGLTWATPPDNNTVYTHPNHSGEVTSTGDGATVIADNIVDEANLKVSNTPTNGQFLSAQSGNTGGLTWANVTIPPAGNTFTAVANGAIANNKAVKLDTDGKVSQVASVATPVSSINNGTQTGSGSWSGLKVGTKNGSAFSVTSGLGYFFSQDADNSPYQIKVTAVRFDGNDGTFGIKSGASRQSAVTLTTDQCYRPHAAWDSTNNKVLVVYKRDSNGGVYGTWITPNQSSDPFLTASGTELAVYPYAVDDVPKVLYAGSGRYLAAFNTKSSGNYAVLTKAIYYNSGNYSLGAYGSISAAGTNSQRQTEVDLAYHTANDKVIAVWRDATDNNYGKIRVGSWTGSGSNLDISWGTESTFAAGAIQHPQVIVDDNTGKIVVCYYNNSSNTWNSKVGVLSGTTATFGSAVTISSVGGMGGSDDWGFELIYVLGVQKVKFYWNGNTGGYKGQTATGTVSSSSSTITWSNVGTIMSNGFNKGTTVFAATPDSTYNRVFYYGQDTSYTTTGRFKTEILTTPVSNLTNANHFVGFADQAYTNGQTATIKTYGNNVDTLSGLTAGTEYYLQGDGTVATSSGFTSFATNTPLAGTALSATKLLIRDPLAKT